MLWPGRPTSTSAYPVGGFAIKSSNLEATGSASVIGCHNIPSPTVEGPVGHQASEVIVANIRSPSDSRFQHIAEDSVGVATRMMDTIQVPALQLQNFENRMRNLEGELAKAQQKVSELTAALESRSRSPSPSRRGDSVGRSSVRSVSNGGGRRTPRCSARKASESMWSPAGNSTPTPIRGRGGRGGTSSPRGNRTPQKRESSALTGASPCDAVEPVLPLVSPHLSNQGTQTCEGTPNTFTPGRGSRMPVCNVTFPERIHESPHLSLHRPESPRRAAGSRSPSPSTPGRGKGRSGDRQASPPRAVVRSASPRELRQNEGSRRQGKMPTPAPPPRLGPRCKVSSSSSSRKAPLRQPARDPGRSCNQSADPVGVESSPSARRAAGNSLAAACTRADDMTDESKRPLVHKQVDLPVTVKVAGNGREEPARKVHESGKGTEAEVDTPTRPPSMGASSVPSSSIPGSLTSTIPMSPHVHVAPTTIVPSMVSASQLEPGQATLQQQWYSPGSCSLPAGSCSLPAGSCTLPAGYLLRPAVGQERQCDSSAARIAVSSSRQLRTSKSASAVGIAGPSRHAAVVRPGTPSNMPPPIVMNRAGYSNGRLSHPCLGSMSGTSLSSQPSVGQLALSPSAQSHGTHIKPTRSSSLVIPVRSE